MFKKQVCLIVIIAEIDWYGLIPNFDFPRGIFLQFQIVGEKPHRVFLKIQIDFFELLFITMQNKRYIKNFRGKKKIPPQGFPPTGFFTHKIKWEKNPAGFFIQK